MKFLNLAIVAVIAAAPTAQAAEQSVDFYMVHGKARAAVLGKCRKDPKVLGKTLDCRHAEAADFRLKNSHKVTGGARKPGGGHYTGKTY